MIEVVINKEAQVRVRQIFMQIRQNVGVINEEPSKYDVWCLRARDVARELRLNPKVGDGA